METYVIKIFENMYKITFAYKHAIFTLKAFIHIPKKYTSPYHK